jgi:hypothetical protein
MLLTSALAFGLSPATRASGTVTNCTEAELVLALRDGGVVTLACDGTVKLAQTLIIATETILDGSGHQPAIAAAGTNVNRLFLVLPGARLTLRHLSVTGAAFTSLTPTNAPSGRSGDPVEGAALYLDRGLVTLEDCTFSGHQVVGGAGANATTAGGDGGDGGAGSGAAVYNMGGQMLITNSTFRLNRASGGAGGAGTPPLAFGSGGSGGRGGAGSGAAIYNTGRALLTIYDSTFSNNTVLGGQGGAGGAGVALGVAGDLGDSGSAQGAALYNDSGEVTIVNSTFSGNSGTGAAGIRGMGLTNSFVAQSGSGGGNALGGGVFNRSGTVVITRCRFLGNTLVGGAGGDGGLGTAAGLSWPGGTGGDGGAALGGGIYIAFGATAALTDNTFSDNSVTGGVAGTGGLGGGIAGRAPSGQTGLQAGPAVFNSGGVLQFLNTISIQPLGNDVSLSWPDVGAVTLQTSSNLALTDSWRTVTNQAASASGLNTLRMTATNPAAFFRLQSP